MQPARNIIIMKSMKKAYSQNEIQSQTSHGVGHKPPVSESGHMGDEGFMPYKHGLLSCLGLTSNNYRSIACFHCVQSRRRGMR
ncbi:hypothetical protein KP509_01G122100 [Ceratopteris richardii]|nr:hypothetical protein KP509_01G122100 [Ceratopteris richardii]